MSRSGHLEIHDMFSCQSSYFASKDRGIDKSLALAKIAQQVSVPWADCHFSVSLCPASPP